MLSGEVILQLQHRIGCSLGLMRRPIQSNRENQLQVYLSTDGYYKRLSIDILDLYSYERARHHHDPTRH